MKVDGNAYFELSPASFGQFEGSRIHRPRRVIETGMQLEHDSFDQRPEVLIVGASYVHRPFVRMISALCREISVKATSPIERFMHIYRDTKLNFGRSTSHVHV